MRRQLGAISVRPEIFVYAEYETNAGQLITTGSFTTVDFEDLVADTHNAVTTGASWVFTAPIPGIYMVNTNIEGTTGGTTQSIIDLRRNASTQERLDVNRVSGPDTQTLNGSKHIRLLAGDTIDIRAISGVAYNLDANATLNWITIARVGDLSGLF